MEKINIRTLSVDSEIWCGEGAFEKFISTFKNDKIFVVTDSNVFALYGELIKNSFPHAHVHVIKAGEKSKNHNVLLSIFKSMIEAGVTRASTVVAFGGGVVGDITGLAASLYMRGVKLVQIPTTLLSQVDSSVGGKTAIDMFGVKNVAGTFYQPAQVVVDPLFLRTLPAREIRCGLGEIVKYGALDKGVYDLLNGAENLKTPKFLEKVTPLCIRHKAAVVTKDEHDILGERKSLNLGHTTGHAFELFYKRKSHGEFVLIGMCYELFIAVNRGVCGEKYAQSLRALIKKVVKKIPAYTDAATAATAAKYDKKNADQATVSIVVPKAEGEWTEISLDLNDYLKQIEHCAQAIRSGKW